MDENALVIVESPTKAKTIKRFLPKGFVVEASIGHVRDLPQTAADVPAKYKKEDWGRLGINVEEDFKPLYITPKDKKKIVSELKKKVKNSDVIYLATDEDREGESISWHLIDVLKPKAPVKRMVFHEITKSAIEAALESPREINMDLVNAQETRRILDRLYGFTLSPLIWKKIAYGLSAGRVQSPGLRMIVQRERERIRFRKSVYWDLKAELSCPDCPSDLTFEARLIEVDGKRVAGGKDFDSATGKVLENKDVRVLTEDEANELLAKIQKLPWSVTSTAEKESKSRPAAPFITSTLQQEGNRKLGLSARETMRTAQRLYENGLITYMRTDSPTLSQEAIQGARKAIEDRYGKDYLSEEPRQYSSRSQSAQEAHEAIRPAGSEFPHPDETELSGREKRLYELIWKRTLASQMADARKSSVRAEIETDGCLFVANGSRILFPGYLRVYVEGKDDPNAALEDREVLLPELEKGKSVAVEELDSLYHETKPPARYTEASLVRALENKGIGRPSTYASIIATLFERDYIRKQDSALVPTYTGFAVIQLLEDHFKYLIDYTFTSDMEEALDQIASGQLDRLQYLKDFYKGKNGLRGRVDDREGLIKPDASRTVQLEQVGNGTQVRVGRFGAYLIHKDDGSEEIRATIPEEIAPADLTQEEIDEIIEIQKRGPVSIGKHPDSDEDIYCLIGRYGPYVQLGEQIEDGPKPKRAGVPKGMKPKDVTLELAVKLLSLPRTLGQHPETGKDVAANVGRFGPFVVHDGDFRSLKKDDDVYTVGLDRALELLAQEKKTRRSSKVVNDLGTDEAGGNKKVAVYDGKYGFYIKYGSKNIPLPEEKKNKEAVEKLTLAEALEIVKASKK